MANKRCRRGGRDWCRWTVYADDAMLRAVTTVLSSEASIVEARGMPGWKGVHATFDREIGTADSEMLPFLTALQWDFAHVARTACDECGSG